MHIGTKRSKEEKKAKEERWAREAAHNAAHGEPYNPAVRVDRTPQSDVHLNVSSQTQPLVHVTVQRSGPPHVADPAQAPPQPGWGQSMPPMPGMPQQFDPNQQPSHQVPVGYDLNGTPIDQYGNPIQGLPPLPVASQQPQMQQPPQYAPQPQMPMGGGAPQGSQIRVTTTTGEPAEVNLSVVLSSHMRPQMTEPQLVALLNQTVRPRHQTVIVTAGVPVHEQALMGYAQIRTTLPLTPWWRFQVAPTLTDATHVAVLDDDTQPGPRWFEAAMRYLADHPHDCVCAAGIVLDEKNGETRIGPTNKPTALTAVDVGEGGWVMRSDVLAEVLHAFPKLPGQVYGWGPLISFGVQPEGRCVVLPYDGEADGMLRPASLDQFSLRRAPSWSEEHHAIIRDFRSAGWKLVNVLAAVEAASE